MTTDDLKVIVASAKRIIEKSQERACKEMREDILLEAHTILKLCGAKGDARMLD